MASLSADKEAEIIQAFYCVIFDFDIVYFFHSLDGKRSPLHFFRGFHFSTYSTC